MCFFSFCVCVFFIGVLREIYLKTTTTRTNTPFPPPLYFASFHKTPRSKISTKILTLYAPSDPNRIFEGTCTGFGAYFSFLHRLVWCEFAVCCLTFIFITFLVSSAWTQYWQTSPSKTENCICYQLLMKQTWQTTSYGIRIHRLSYTLNPRPCHSIIYIN